MTFLGCHCDDCDDFDDDDDDDAFKHAWNAMMHWNLHLNFD